MAELGKRGKHHTSPFGVVLGLPSFEDYGFKELEMSNTRTAEEHLLSLSKRFVSHTTHIRCAECGKETPVSNRVKSPFSVVNLNNGLYEVNFVCAVNGCQYDLTTCCGE